MAEPIIIRGDTIRNIGIAFQTKFKGALKSAVSLYPKIATSIPSTTKVEEYGWLNDLPGVREWVGDRYVRQHTASSYRIENRDWEITVGIDRNTVEDDNLGLLSTHAAVMADSTQRHYDELVFAALKNGFSAACYDGQYYFDTDHPITDADGKPVTFANTDGGAGNAWFLAVTGMPLLPIILQKRRDYTFVSKDSPNDDGVFWQKKLLYGADARYAVGYSLPQLCWGSKQTLDADHFETAYDALFAMPRDGGSKIAPTKFSLFVGPSNRAAAEKVIGAEFLAGGASNVNYNKADLTVVPWLD